jgi:hypothetical protein
MKDEDGGLRALLLTLDPKARDDLRRVLIGDQADRDAISSRLMRYRDRNGQDWADIIDFLAMYPDARRWVARVLGEIDAHSGRRLFEVVPFWLLDKAGPASESGSLAVPPSPRLGASGPIPLCPPQARMGTRPIDRLRAAIRYPGGKPHPGLPAPPSAPVTHAQPSCRGNRARRLLVPKLHT